jgi:signal transduction histidine kinase
MASRRFGTTAGYVAVYAVAAYAGLEATQQAGGLAVFWPASGVAALWLLRGRTRGEVLLDAALLLAVTVAVDLVLDLPRTAAVMFALANLTIAFTVRLSSSLSERRPFGGPLPRRVARKRDLLALGLASLAAATASLPFGLVGAYAVSNDLSWATAMAWLVRNTCSTFLVCASVLAMFTAVHRARKRGGDWEAIFTPEPRRFWVPELFAASAVTLTGALLLFATTEHLPIAFLLMLVSTWIGYRFTPAVGGVQSIALGSLVVLCTQAGRGSFAAIADPTGRAVVAQVYVLAATVMVLVISLGVAERTGLVARVRESEARATSRAELLDAVMNVMTDGLVVLESAGEVMMRNPAAAAMMGPHRRTGEDSPDDYGIFHLDGTSIDREDLPHTRALQGELAPAADVLRIDPRTGQQAVLSIGALPLHPAGSDPMAVVVIHDVTQERTQRRELEAFAGTVAHDLKTPLTGVGSWAEILGDQLDGLEVDVTAPRSSLRRIETSAARMQQLIADLLAYSQAQSATLSPTSLSLTGMVEAVARELREAHADAGKPVIEHGPLGQVYADRTLVGQLLANVIGNAVKYVAPGTTPHVLIGSELIGDMLEIRVADNGIGIPRAERGRIFDNFYRASSSGGYPGTGLGLAICARAVQRHGGRISAREGLDGGGTTLVFTLPADLETDREGLSDDQRASDQRAGETTRAEPPPRRTGSETAVR